VHEFYGPVGYDFAAALGQMVWSAMRVESLAVQTCRALDIDYRPGMQIGVSIAEATESLTSTSAVSEVDGALWLLQAGAALRTRDTIVHAAVTSSMAANGNTVEEYYFHNRKWDSEGELTGDDAQALTVEALDDLRGQFDELARRWTHVDGSLGARTNETSQRK